MDSSHEPLISDRDAQGEEHQREFEDAASDVAASEAGKSATARPGLFVLLLTFAAGISGLLFGCEFSSSRVKRYSCCLLMCYFR
jgi:SP family myo-inositol transporter-like MFS transporter 13